MATILAYTPGAAGHLFPIMPGLLALRERGHEVHVRTGAHLLDAARDAGLNAEAIDPRITDVPVRDYEARRDIDRLKRGIADMLGRGPLEREDFDRAVRETQPDVVVADINTYGAAVAAEASGRPWGITLPSLLALPARASRPTGSGWRRCAGRSAGSVTVRCCGSSSASTRRRCSRA